MSTKHPYLGDDFDKWTSQWEKAQSDGTFESAPKPVQTAGYTGDDFFGNHKPGGNKSIKDSDAEYWRQVYGMSRHAGDVPDPLEAAEVLQESKASMPIEKLVPGGKPDHSKSMMKKKVGMMADDPQPQRSDAYGQDGVDGDTGMTRVNSGWAADERLATLEDLKKSLYEFECKMSDSGGLSEAKVKTLSSKLTNIRKQIDDMSNDLVPRYPSDHI